jgi:hypothetical protein
LDFEGEAELPHSYEHFEDEKEDDDEEANNNLVTAHELALCPDFHASKFYLKISIYSIKSLEHYLVKLEVNPLGLLSSCPTLGTLIQQFSATYSQFR